MTTVDKNSGVEFSNTMYQWKAIALVSIVMAHSWYTYIENPYVVSICARFTKFGVFVFLFLSGYFFDPQKYTFSEFWKKKLRTLGIPWIVAAALTYCLRFRVYGFYVDIKEFVNWTLGNGSWLYWLSILVMCYLIYWKVFKSKTLCILSVGLTIASLLLTAFGRLPAVVDTDKWAFTYLNPYLNIFNWIGIFALGILAKNGKLEELVMKFTQSSVKAWAAVFISILGWMVLAKIDPNTEYWSWGGVLAEPLMSIGALAISCRVKNGRLDKILSKIGKITLPIYLYHMPIQEQILKSRESLANVRFAFLRPVITILICTMIFICVDKVTCRVSNKLNELYKTAVGLR